MTRDARIFSLRAGPSSAISSWTTSSARAGYQGFPDIDWLKPLRTARTASSLRVRPSSAPRSTWERTLRRSSAFQDSRWNAMSSAMSARTWWTVLMIWISQSLRIWEAMVSVPMRTFMKARANARVVGLVEPSPKPSQLM